MVSLSFKNVQSEGRRDVLGKVKWVKVWLGHAEGIERKTDYVIGDRIEGKRLKAGSWETLHTSDLRVSGYETAIDMKWSFNKYH